jgi:hypothetical protein
MNSKEQFMNRITVSVVRDAYARMGYQPCQGEWRREGKRQGRTVPVEMACPQATILELEGLITHDEEGPNIETAADDEWGAAYANGFRDGWDSLDSNPRFATDSPQDRADYGQGFEDGRAAASELLPTLADA